MVPVKPALIASIPQEVRAQIDQRFAVEVGFGAGPSFAGVKIEKLEPAVSLEHALEWLERYRATFRRGHVRLDDGTLLYFDPNGFLRIVSRADSRAC